MSKNKILWSLFSTILISNSHSVDAATPPSIEQKIGVARSGKVSIDSVVEKAAVLINKGLPEQAIVLLEPYIKDNTGTNALQETYVEAIFKSGTDEIAIEETKRIWPKKEKMPISIQKMIAEGYLRLGKSAEALASFRTLTEIQPQDKGIKANLAYALVYSGQTFEGLGIYDQLLRNNPDMAGAFVEDAVALLSQGNILGGRSLFENIVALYPEKVEYRQRYAEALRTYNIERPAEIQYKELAKVQNISESAQRQQSHERAVELAREQHFPEALATLRWLHESAPANQNITFDYVTVLHWSGNDQEAVKIYEELHSVQIPQYVRQNIVDAYYKLGDYQKALATLRSLATGEARDNKLREADILMHLGEKTSAQVIYDELINADPKDVEVYLRRGTLAMSLGDSQQGVWSFEQALRIIPQVPENEIRIRQIRADLAAGYINLRQPARAIPLLAPDVNVKKATISMQGNYILALREMGKYKLVTTEAKRIWPDYTKAPLFGLRAVAESYIQLKDIPKAIVLYQQMIAMTPDDVPDQTSLAFNLMLDGKLVQGLEVYKQLLVKHPDTVTNVIQDATIFIETDKYVIGKSLFGVVISQFSDQALYRRQYADVLARNYLYQSAYSQYESISQTPDFRVVGLIGMAKMALALDDYKKVKQNLDILKAEYGRSRAVAALATGYDEHKQGRVDTWFSSNASHKQTRDTEWNLTAEQYLQGNYWIMAGVGNTRVDDFTANAHQIVKTKMIAVRYDDLYQKTELRYNSNSNGDWNSGTFHLSSERSLTDEVSVKFEVGRSLVSDVQALSQVGGPIFSNNYGMTLSKKLSNRENVAIGLNRSLYSDGNQGFGYSLDHNYTLYSRGTDTLTRNLFWNRAWFGLQNLVYESPALRESMGAEWTLRRAVPQGYWQGKVVANWDRDYPDGLAFNPYVRLEYYHEFTTNRSLRIGAEYGLRSDNPLGKGGFKYGYRQFDALYTMTW